MWKSACTWLLQKIAGSFPRWNVDDLHTDPYYYKKQNALMQFLKIYFFFWYQNLNLWGKFLQKMASCKKYMTKFVVSHLQGECSSLTPIKRLVLDNVLVYHSNVFLLHRTAVHMQMPKGSEKDGSCSLVTYTYFLARLNEVHRELLYYPQRRH